MASFVFGALFSFGQENPGSALALTLTNYMNDTYNGTGCSSVSGSLGSSGSGQPTCFGIDNNDVWYTFTATTQAAKFNVTSGAFNAVVEVLETGTLNSVACVNDNAATGSEVLKVNGLTIGSTYHLRIHSTNGTGGSFTVCGQFYPLCEVRPTHSPTPPTDNGLPGYKLVDLTARTQYGLANNLTQAARWYFTDVISGDQFFLQVNGSNSLLQLNAVGGLCFGNTYNVQVEVQVDNFWCGTSNVRQIQMESVAVAEISPAVIGGTYTAAGQINSLFVGTGNIFEWRFTTDNGTTQFTIENAPNTSILQLSAVPCLRYNRIYTIEVRVMYCGEWGPWSAPGFIFTGLVPYVDVRDEFCNTVQTTGDYITCDFTPNVSAYAWQFAPIEPGDQTMTPIGPAIVSITPTTSMYLLLLDLTPGTTYRVGTKALFGLSDGCGTPQEGDYGNFCTITIAGGNNLIAPDDIAFMETAGNGTELTPNLFERGRLTIYPNPSTGGIINVALDNAPTNGLLDVQLLDLSGRLVYAETRSAGMGANIVQLALPGSVNRGQYLLRITHESGTSVGRLIVQ